MLPAESAFSGLCWPRELGTWDDSIRAQEGSFLTPDDEPQPAGLPAPLTRRNTAGGVYARTAAVERELMDLLTLSSEERAARTAVAEPGHPGYVSEESLVYLVRHYLRRDERTAFNDTAARLIDRYTAMVRKYLGTLGAEAVKEGHSEITQRLFAVLLDLTTDRADFLEVRFWMVLKTLCIKEFNRQLKERKRARQQLPLSVLPGQGPASQDPSEHLAIRLTDADERRLSSSPHEESLLEREQSLQDEDLRKAALEQLAEPLRSTFILRHYYGWPIEHRDPSVPSISRHFGKTPRTVQNWLKKAEETLETWRGGQDD
jgi:DNA-directed RNA polymerase specialized sigma24 family protein